MQLPSKSTRRKTKGNMHFLFFYCFAVTKKLQKIQTVLKKRRRRRIYTWETNIFKQATQGLGLTEVFGSHWNKVGHLMSRSSISQLLIRSSKHRKATSRAPKRHNHCAQNAGARKLLNYLKCQRNSLEKKHEIINTDKPLCKRGTTASLKKKLTEHKYYRVI